MPPICALCSLLRLGCASQGATVVDFAYHVHTDVGNQMFGAKVNGKAVHAGHALANAEVVEVLTYDGVPTPGSIARHQVRSLLSGCCPDEKKGLE